MTTVPEADHEAGRGRASILELRNVEVIYGGAILALRGVSLRVPVGGIVALLGANGAGKTTTLRAITNLLTTCDGEVTQGSVTFDEQRIDGLDAAAIVRRGVSQVMEGRRVFAELTVDENLATGAFTRRDRTGVKDAYARVMDLFPRLQPRRKAVAGYLSGGEQQMLAIGRALMQSPRLLLLDEPSLGLAPLLVEQVAEAIVDIGRQGTSILLVEQNATIALDICDEGYVLENGRIVKDGAAGELLADRDIQEFYLGVSEAGGRSFRDVKTYRRRKRWSA